MAIDFRVQGVDFTGVGNAIAQGLQNAAAIRAQQDQIVRKEIDEFKSTYDTGKIMPKDIPLFASEFDNYKKAAIEYSKMNKGRTKSSELAAKKAELDAAKGKMNLVYENSAKSASVLEGLVKYADRMTAAGYALPDDMNRDIVMYKTQPIDKIDFTKAKAPTEYSFEANETDFAQLDKTLAGIKENKGEATIGTAFPIEIGQKDKPGYKVINVPEREKFSIKDPYAVLGRITDALGADARIKNAAVTQKNNLMASLNSTATDTDSLIAKQLAKKTADKVLVAYPELDGDISKATPAMVIAASRGYLNRNTLGTSVSMKEFDAQLAALKLNMADKNTQERIKLAKDKIRGKNQQASASVLRLIIETGGAFYSDAELEDMGLTRDEIKNARAASIRYNLERGYRPGSLQ